MNRLKYLLQFIFIFCLLLIFRLIGIKFSRFLSKKIFTLLGPLIRSNKISYLNLSNVFSNFDDSHKKKIIKNMWSNYGKIFAEYVFIKNFNKKSYFEKNIIIENYDELLKIKENRAPVIFISGHFNNFELMAMHIEKTGIELAAVYRPLNNIFLNPIMERIRKKYICKNQIKKGIGGMKKLIKLQKKIILLL